MHLHEHELGENLEGLPPGISTICSTISSEMRSGEARRAVVNPVREENLEDQKFAIHDQELECERYCFHFVIFFIFSFFSVFIFFIFSIFHFFNFSFSDFFSFFHFFIFFIFSCFLFFLFFSPVFLHLSSLFFFFLLFVFFFSGFLEV